jgi:hypothetical protein
MLLLKQFYYKNVTNLVRPAADQQLQLLASKAAGYPSIVQGINLACSAG